VQHRIPIWVVAAWPHPKSMRRGLRCDGIIAEGVDSLADARAVRAWLAERDGAEIDLITEGETSPMDSVTAWAEAGCTWWLESRWEMPHHSPERMDQVRRRITACPPR
jgi:hypothetical protein